MSAIVSGVVGPFNALLGTKDGRAQDLAAPLTRSAGRCYLDAHLNTLPPERAELSTRNICLRLIRTEPIVSSSSPLRTVE